MAPEAQASTTVDSDLSAAFVGAISRDAEQLAAKMVGLAEAMPADKYDWRPGDGVMSVGEVFMHVAAYNYFYPSMAGAPIPDGVGVTTDYSTVGAFEDSRSNRDEIIEALKASFEHLEQVTAGASPSTLDDMVSVFGNDVTVQEAWMGTLTHIHEHLGQSIAYARTNGIVPPWSM